MNVVFELYGPARLRAGQTQIPVVAETVGEALCNLATACPPLAGHVIEQGRLSRHYRLSLNGRRFISDPEHPLTDADHLILLSAEAGG
jgi:molybdopterin converting factor small subunit